MLLDDEYLRLCEADVVILDVQSSRDRQPSDSPSWSSQLRHDLTVSGKLNAHASLFVTTQSI